MVSFAIFPKVLLAGIAVFFLVLFFSCTVWVNDYHPERKFIISFLISVFHTFWFLVVGFIFLILIYFLLG